MKKLIRFIVALISIPILIFTTPFVMLMGYAFDEPVNIKQSFKGWLRCITFKD